MARKVTDCEREGACQENWSVAVAPAEIVALGALKTFPAEGMRIGRTVSVPLP